MTFSPPYVSLTFDDGYKSQYTDMLPILDRHGLKGTFYTITDRIGAPNYFNFNQLKKIYFKGHEIGSHTVSHPKLNTLSYERIEWELKRSKQIFERNGIFVKTLAYPYGAYLPRIEKICKKYYVAARGYCFTSNLRTYCAFGYNSLHNINKYCLNVFPTELYTPYGEPLMSLPFNLFKERVKGIIQETIEKKLWSIFVFHGARAIQKQSFGKSFGFYFKYLAKKIFNPPDLIRIIENKVRKNLENKPSDSINTANMNIKNNFKSNYFKWLCEYLDNNEKLKVFTISDIIEKF